jgi:hypothetical protein
MSRVDEFSGTSPAITRIEWRDGDGTSWGDFVPDPNDAARRTATVTGPAGGQAVAEVFHADGTTRVYVVKVGDRVVWDSGRGTYTFPR